MFGIVESLMDKGVIICLYFLGGLHTFTTQPSFGMVLHVAEEKQPHHIYIVTNNILFDFLFWQKIYGNQKSRPLFPFLCLVNLLLMRQLTPPTPLRRWPFVTSPKSHNPLPTIHPHTNPYTADIRCLIPF